MIATKQIAVTDNNSRNYRQHTIIRKKICQKYTKKMSWLNICTIKYRLDGSQCRLFNFISDVWKFRTYRHSM